MREIKLAEHSGFCFGVKRALEKTLEEIDNPERNKDGRILTCGPLIHNKTVTDDLERKGVLIINSLSEANKGDTVVVRSHGEGKAFFDEANERGVRLIDATCPFVEKIQNLVLKAHNDGKKIIIVGDENHPEVKGINGWCDNSAVTVNSREDALNIPDGEYFLVCQTTSQKSMLDEIISALSEKDIECEINNTICNATTLRQESTKNLSGNSEYMVIIGDKNSSNSRKLFEIAKKQCKNAVFIEKKDDLCLQEISKYSKIGVAGGASTPEALIKEVIAKMSENLNMADFMEDIEKSLRLPKLGEIVNGTVHQVTEKEIIVNMGCKKDGIIPKEEVTLEGEQKLTDLFKAGDDIQAKVIKTDDGEGIILLSKKKLEANANWTEILDAYENKTVLNVKVVRQVNGGVIANYKEVSGFIPLSQLSDKFVENAEEFIGQNLDIRVTRVDQRRGRAVFSHKAIAFEEKQARLQEVWEKLDIDDIVEGKVMRFTDYGAFIDLGGIDGLLHISEISWGKLKHPEEVLAIGDTVKVKILSMNKEKGKISLGLKQTTPEPWSVINEKYAIGQTVKGKVVQIKEYGAFVELEPGLDGLVHISEVAHKRVTDIAEELILGSEVEAKILEIDEEKKRISLSIKALIEPPQATEEDVEEEAPVEAVAPAEVEAESETEAEAEKAEE